jgi:predicted DsbA family dithiol-disulfide isomerase
MVYANAAKVGLDIAKLKADLKDPAIQQALDASIALARKTGIDGTPTFILNGKLRPGMVDDDTLEQAMKS